MTRPSDRWPRCRRCGDVLYVGMRQTATYCGAACRSRAWRERRRSVLVLPHGTYDRRADGTLVMRQPAAGEVL